MTFKDGRPVRTPFYDQVLSEASASARSSSSVCIDTVADTFGGDQNNMGHARQFVQGSRRHRPRDQRRTIAAAHPSQHGKSTGSGESGSVQWDAAFRSRLYIDSPEDSEGEFSDENSRVLTRKKANYASRNETIEMRWQDGVFVSTAPPTGILGTIECRNCEQYLDLLERLTAGGRHVSHKHRAGDYAPRIFSLRPDREGFAKADFERAMHSLMASRQIMASSYKDPYRKDIECLVAAD